MTNIAYGEISMEHLFAKQRLLSVVLNLQLHFRLAPIVTEPQGRLGIAESTSGVIRPEGSE